MDTNLYKQEGYDLVGAAYEVYNELGPGFLEEVYQEALEIELSDRKVLFERQPKLEIEFKGNVLSKFYRPELYVSSAIVVELKAQALLRTENQAQLLNYLKATDKPVGYLINFGNPNKLEFQRMLNPYLLKISSNQ